MNDNNNEYLMCYLAAWIVDRIVTEIINKDRESFDTARLSSYKRLHDQANIIYNAFNDPTKIDEEEE